MNNSFNYSNVSCYRCHEKRLILDYQSGDIICCNCGEIISDRIIDESNEVHVYENDTSTKKSSRSSGLSDSIGCYQTTFVSSNSNNNNLVQSLERAQKLSADPKEQKVLMHLSLVNETCSKMNLSTSIKVSNACICVIIYYISTNLSSLFDVRCPHDHHITTLRSIRSILKEILHSTIHCISHTDQSMVTLYANEW